MKEEDTTDFRASFFGRIVEDSGPFLFSAIIDAMSRSPDPHPADTAKRVAAIKFPRARLAFLLSSRRRNPREQAPLRYAVTDRDPAVRRAAVQWIAEERLTGFRPRVEAILDDASRPMTTGLFLATIAALEILDGVDPADIDQTPASKYVIPLLQDEKRPPAVRAQALRLVAATDPAFDAKLFRGLLDSDNAALILETVRTLQNAPVPEATELLSEIATDDGKDASLRAEAIVGLATFAKTANSGDPSRQILIELLNSSDQRLRRECIRALRGSAANDPTVRSALLRQAENLQYVAAVTPAVREMADQLAFALAGDGIKLPRWVELYRSKRPANREQWKNELLRKPTPAKNEALEKGDPSAGRRVFFHVNGAGCYKCHTINGRGGRVGPDLSNIGRGQGTSRQRLIDSILDPNKEIAPQFTSWTMVAESGKVHTGMIVEENKGTLLLGDADGRITELKTIDIVERVPQKKSLMPDKLVDRMTIRELRDLLAFLESLK